MRLERTKCTFRRPKFQNFPREHAPRPSYRMLAPAVLVDNVTAVIICVTPASKLNDSPEEGQFSYCKLRYMCSYSTMESSNVIAFGWSNLCRVDKCLLTPENSDAVCAVLRFWTPLFELKMAKTLTAQSHSLEERKPVPIAISVNSTQRPFIQKSLNDFNFSKWRG